MIKIGSRIKSDMASDKMIDLAVLGGAFDPPHNAHLQIAELAIEEYGYKRIIFLPSYNPPHKKLNGATEDRLNMLNLALDGDGRYQISTYEIDRDKIGYTAETLPALKEIYGDFDFIIGGDSMIDMHKWYCPERILNENNIVIAVRNGEYSEVRSAIESFGDCARNVKIMSKSPERISSTDIRLMVRLGEDISEFVPQSVLNYIEDNYLYDDCKTIRDRLMAELSPNRYQHTLSVVHMAMRLNKQYCLDPDKVFYAALLHDSAKTNCINYDYPIPKDAKGTPVEHAFNGAFKAREYGINDEEILNAIYYHTTARRNMTPLEKLIYTADMVEDSRDFDGVEELRRISLENIDNGFKECVKATYEHLKANDTEIYYLTKEAYDYYCTK